MTNAAAPDAAAALRSSDAPTATAPAAAPAAAPKPSPFGDLSGRTMLLIALAFAAAYAVIYGLTALAGRAGGDSAAALATSRTLDAVLLAITLAASLYYYTTFSADQKNDLTGTLLQETKVFYDDPNSMMYFFLATVAFYVIVYTCGVPMTRETQGWMVWFIEVHLWYFLGTLAIDYVMKNYLDVPIADILIEKTGDLLHWMGLIAHEPAPAANAAKVVAGGAVAAPVVQKPEVFHISNNLYDYSEAQSICSAYGATLATYDQLEDAYNNGAGWCGYGWSKGQMALFPTQKSTWTALQEKKGHENSCGRQGINGGYISNPNVKFGVNCFGVKPKGSVAELAAAKVGETPPKSREDEIMEAKARFWAKNKDKMLVLSSFNSKKWSEY